MLPKILTSFCTVLVLTFCANADDPNANELIEMYEKSLSVSDKSAYEVETKMVIEEWKQNPNSPELLIRKAAVYRDADRRATVIEDQYVFKNAQKPVEIFHHAQILGKRHVFYLSEGNEPVDTVYVDSDLETGRAKARAALLGGVIAEGYVWGDGGVRLPDILRSSLTLEVRNDRPEIDGHLTYVLESQGQSGKIKLWLDPKCGFHPRRIEVHKSGKDLLNGRPVSSTRSRVNIVANKQLEKYSVVIDSFKIGEINGVLVMTGANTTETRTYSDGYEVRTIYDFKCSKIDLNPDFNALKPFEIKCPDGTPVSDQDFPVGRFMVLGGKIVPAEDPTFEEIDKRRKCKIVEELKKEQR